ncbi:MAG: hypothetical protein ACXAEU_10155 [Candidatus Hodarchaeales archaeon]|jgi:hypothetical protein
MMLTRNSSDISSGSISDFEIILWIFDQKIGGVPAFSNKDVDNFSNDPLFPRISAKIFSFMAMVTNDLVKQDWSIISLPGNRRALCYGFYIDSEEESGWLVLSITVPAKYSRWLLTYSPDMIPRCRSFFDELVKAGWDWTDELQDIVLFILRDFKDYCKGIDNLGVMDFEGLTL